MDLRDSVSSRLGEISVWVTMKKFVESVLGKKKETKQGRKKERKKRGGCDKLVEITACIPILKLKSMGVVFSVPSSLCSTQVE